MFKHLAVLSLMLCVVYAAIGIGPLEPKPDKFKDEQGCYIKSLDEVIPFGSSKPSRTSCMEYRCGSSLVQYVSCGAVAAAPPCKIVEDKSKPYPGCCKKIACP